MRDKLIKDIEGLYPIDSEYQDTNEIGQVLLLEAMRIQKFDWRDLPTDVLERYKQLCIDEENSGDVTQQWKIKGTIKVGENN